MMEIKLREFVPKLAAKAHVKDKVELILEVARQRFGTAPRTLEKRLLATPSEDLCYWPGRLKRGQSIDEAMDGNGSWGNRAQV